MRLHLPTPLRRALLAVLVTASAFSSAALATTEPNLSITDTIADDFYTDVENALLAGVADPAGTTGTITGTGTPSSSFNARGTIQTGSDTADGSVTAFNEIRLGDQTLPSDMTFNGDMLVDDGGGFSADYDGTVHVTGDVGAETGAVVEVGSNMHLTVDGAMKTTDGKLNVLGTVSQLDLTTAQELSNTDMTVEGTLNAEGLESIGGSTRLAGAAAALHGTGEGDILLSGVMIGSLFSACTSYVKLVADPANQLPEITYWLMGSLSGVRLRDVGFAVIPMLIGLVPLYILRWRINLLTLGEEEARAMGVNTKRLRLMVILCATVLTATSVAVSGMIGWVGLVIPHLSRKLVGNDCRHLLPVSTVFGAIFLLLVDNVSRNLLATEIPIGILTAFVGAPFFLYLMTRKEHTL